MSILNISVVLPKAQSASGVILNGGTKSSVNNFLNNKHISSRYDTSATPYFVDVVKTVDVTDAINVPFSTFAYNNKRPITKGSTILINNSTLQHELVTTGTEQTDLRTNIHFLRYMTTRLLATAIREKHYDPHTNIFETGYPAISYDDFGADRAAIGLSRSNTGKLSYTNGVKPTVQSYQPKTA